MNLKNFSHIDLVIFDLDGTLLDSLDELTAALNLAIEEAGCKKADPDFIKNKLCYGTKSLLGDLVGGDDVLHKVIYEHYMKHYKQIMYQSPLYEGTQVLLERLHTQKKMAILTNKREQTSKTLLKHYNIDHLFDPIVGGDTLHVKKPSPLPIHHICEKVKVEPARTLMVGDSHADIKAGKAAGTYTVGVLNGFTTPDMLLEAKPDHLVETIGQIQSWMV